MAFLFFTPFLRAQDTLNLYYSSGEYKLYAYSKNKLSNFVFSHDLKFVDSISVLGYTDSTGQKAKNMKLSERRARSVKNYLLNMGVKDSVPVGLLAKGEESDNEVKAGINHRRVEVILYFTTSYVPPAEEEEKPSSTFVNSNCYKSADSIMAMCDVTYYSRGSSKYVKLEIEAFQLNPKTRVYSLSARNRYPKLVKWELETTGELWWKRPRYVAHVRLKDFEKYGVVEVTKDTAGMKCTVCGNETQSNWTLYTHRLTTDVFLMQNMQVRKCILPKRMELKVPKEYLSLEKGYYLDSLTNYPIDWIVRSGRKAAPYYYAYIPMPFFEPNNFRIYSYRGYCLEADITDYSFHVDTLKRHVCPPVSSYTFDYTLGLEGGYRHAFSDEGSFSVYFQPLFGKTVLQTNVGYTSRNRTLIGVQADYHFFAFSPFPETYIAANQQTVDEDHRIFSAYAGTSFTGFLHKSETSLLNEYYLGAAFWNKAQSFGLDRIFLQAGWGLDFLGDSNFKGLVLRAGIQVKL